MVCGAMLACGGPMHTASDAGPDSGPRQLWNDTDAAFDGCGIPLSSRPASLSPCESLCYEQATCIEINGRFVDPQRGELNGQVYENLDICLNACAN